MFNFKKKKNENTADLLNERDEKIIDIMRNQLELIRGLKDNEKIICEAIMNQQKAIQDLQNQVKELRKLANQNEGV